MSTFSDKIYHNHIDGALFAILPVVEQVRNLHAKGRFGFDICPQNIAMTRRGAWLRVKNMTLNAGGANVFRPGFTPRERYMGGMPGPWTDVYAVSALVYTAMTGLMLPSAFERDAAEPLFSGLDEKYRALEEAVTQGLNPDATERQTSLDTLSAQIQACLSEYNPPSAKHEDTKHRLKKPKQTAAAASIAVLLLLSGTVIVNEVNYAQAATHAEAGEFALAQNSLKGVLAFYKDAAQLSDYADAGINLENGAFDTAARDFLALGGYRSSKEMARETDYRHAQALFEQGNLAEAQTLLQSIGDYKYAFEILKQINYETGKTYLEADMYLSALEAFNDAADYADAALQAEAVKDKLYAAAVIALNAGDTDTAAQYFAAMPGYKQADEMGYLTELLSRVQRGEALSQNEYEFMKDFADTVDLSVYLDSDSRKGY